jgi:hypothetical protein
LIIGGVTFTNAGNLIIYRWSQAAIAGILGEAIYAPYDITGNQIKYLNVLYQLVK